MRCRTIRGQCIMAISRQLFTRTFLFAPLQRSKQGRQRPQYERVPHENVQQTSFFDNGRPNERVIQFAHVSQPNTATIGSTSRPNRHHFRASSHPRHAQNAIENGPLSPALLLFPLQASGRSVLSKIGLSAALSAKSPAGGWVQGCPWKTFSQVFATMPAPLFRRPLGSVRVLMRTRETLFAATASGSSSATS